MFKNGFFLTKFDIFCKESYLEVLIKTYEYIVHSIYNILCWISISYFSSRLYIHRVSQKGWDILDDLEKMTFSEKNFRTKVVSYQITNHIVILVWYCKSDCANTAWCMLDVRRYLNVSRAYLEWFLPNGT